LSTARPAPGLLLKTLAVTFLTVIVLLVVVFTFVTMRAQQQVRESVTANLESTERLFAALETQRQGEMRAHAWAVAENPTLKAALDTYGAEARTSTPEERAQWLATMVNELNKLARAVGDADAIVLVDSHQHTMAAAGRMASSWPEGRPITVPGAGIGGGVDTVAQVAGASFRLVSVPLLLDDGTTIGTLYLANSLDQKYADDLKRLSRAETAIINDGLMLATTLPREAGKEFEAVIAQRHQVDGTAMLDGQSYAFRRLVQVGPTAGFYALSSIDESSRTVLATLRRDLGITAAGAILLALLGSVWLAHLVSKPIGRLATSLEAMAVAHSVDTRIPLSGSSRELDALTETFNALMASVNAAESQREAAYTGAIRALAAALDARDPYTAGHSDRVSVLSVAIGRALRVPLEELEVIRLGALLHDIGKIGVPDAVLLKPGRLTDREYDVIKQHPVLGARILRSVPFLAAHLPIVELHHERPDGRGYPHGLRADDIPLAARIVHVADAYDAMTSARAYRAARPSSDALRELWRCSGTEFHAEIVGALATALPGVTSEAGDLAVEAVSG
jgi:putative nucleotidyltransferase with HDIG domain